MSQGDNPCLTESETDCRVSRSVYVIECQDCGTLNPPTKSVYVGTTGRTTHSRMVEHAKALQSDQRKNALVKHKILMHLDTNPEFKAKIVKGGIRYNLDRFVLESQKIQEANDDPGVIVLNSKSEWGSRGVPRLTVDQ